jgi:hypothetical protein
MLLLSVDHQKGMAAVRELAASGDNTRIVALGADTVIQDDAGGGVVKEVIKVRAVDSHLSNPS